MISGETFEVKPGFIVDMSIEVGAMFRYCMNLIVAL